MSQNDAVESGRTSVVRIKRRKGESPLRLLANVLTRLLIICFSVAFFGYLLYTAFFWFDSWRTGRIYEVGTYRAPLVEEMVMEDGQLGHALTFFGNDGDLLFIPELNRSFPFVGGMTEIDIADSSWFDLSPEGETAAIINMTPVVLTNKNGRVALPGMQLTVETPQSPLEMIEPKSDREEVDTSKFELKIKVVRGSKVLVNGEDQTDMVNNEGELLAVVDVDDIGDNPISVSVSTAHHRETRKDIILYREPQTIEMERSMNTVKSTTKSSATISGTVEVGANIVVDSTYNEGSLEVKENGSFSFKVPLPITGDNVITWHATMQGRQDQYASYTIYHVPPLTEYGGKAWKMDYKGLLDTNERWSADNRIFAVIGPVVEVWDEEGTQMMAIDVAPAEAEERQICVLENRAAVQNPEKDRRYKAYADVQPGLVFYNGANCPKLVCRYLVDP